MFSQRKSFMKGKLFYLILIGLFAFGYWVNQTPVSPISPENVKTGTNYSVEKQKPNKSSNQEQDSYDILDNMITGSQGAIGEMTDNKEPAVSDPDDRDPQGYYLIKEVDGLIKIFYYDKGGKEKLIRTTDIAFSLLSTNDQFLFQKGIMKQTEEELEELLQDFES